MLSLAKK